MRSAGEGGGGGVKYLVRAGNNHNLERVRGSFSFYLVRAGNNHMEYT